MVTASFRFPAGHYHATPWGHHVNEGLVEWPPSPWRLLRALIATGFTAHGWSEVPPHAASMVERLASVLPRYGLPGAVASHSRHYMPIGGLRDGGVEKTTLVLDAFARVDEGPLVVQWDVELSEEERKLLSSLLSRLGYLGRAESWVEAEIVETSEALGFDAIPSESSASRTPDLEPVSLLAPMTPEAYRAWRTSAGGDVTSEKGAKRSAGGAKKAKAPALPPRLAECLQVTTHTLEAEGWTLPPGSRQVLYLRPANALSTSPAPARALAVGSAVETMLLALSTPSGNPHALPEATRTLPQAELLHVALASHVGRLGRSPSSSGHVHAELLGVDTAGAPLAGHRHAHLLPLDADEDGHLDHVLVWAPMGLGPEAQEAVRAVRKTYAKRVGELQVALVGLGNLAELGDHALLSAVAGPRDGSVEWVTATPFVPPRFVKPRGRNTLEGQVQAELASRGLPPAVEVRVLDLHAASLLRFRHAVVARARGNPPPQRVGLALALRFDSPVRGPLCLGYASHFGLGRFRPADASWRKQ